MEKLYWSGENGLKIGQRALFEHRITYENRKPIAYEIMMPHRDSQCVKPWYALYRPTDAQKQRNSTEHNKKINQYIFGGDWF